MDAILLTVEQIHEFYTANFSEKRVARAERNNSTVPGGGVFYELGYSVFKTEEGKEIKYPVIKISNDNGKVIGEIAVGTLLQQKSANKVRKITRESSEYVGKWFHVGTAINEFEGKNELEIIAGLLGKKFKTSVLKDVRVPAVKIVHDKPVMYDTEEAALQAVVVKDCNFIAVLNINGLQCSLFSIVHNWFVIYDFYGWYLHIFKNGCFELFSQKSRNNLQLIFTLEIINWGSCMKPFTPIFT